MNKNKLNFWLDLVLMLLFVLLIVSLLQGHGRRAAEQNTLHKVVGFLLLAGSFAHLRLHWQWMKAVGKQKNPAPTVHVNWHLDQVLMVTYSLGGLAGLLLLVFPGLHALVMVHRILGLAAIVVQVVHLARHWKWIVSSARRYLPLGLTQQEQSQ